MLAEEGSSILFMKNSGSAMDDLLVHNFLLLIGELGCFTLKLCVLKFFLELSMLKVAMAAEDMEPDLSTFLPSSESNG